jgi:hypothetical protein
MSRVKSRGLRLGLSKLLTLRWWEADENTSGGMRGCEMDMVIFIPAALDSLRAFFPSCLAEARSVVLF